MIFYIILLYHSHYSCLWCCKLLHVCKLLITFKLISLLLLCEGRHGVDYINHKSFLPPRKRLRVCPCWYVDYQNLLPCGSLLIPLYTSAAIRWRRISPCGLNTQFIHHSNSIIIYIIIFYMSFSAFVDIKETDVINHWRVDPCNTWKRR